MTFAILDIFPGAKLKSGLSSRLAAEHILKLAFDSSEIFTRGVRERAG